MLKPRSITTAHAPTWPSGLRERRGRLHGRPGQRSRIDDTITTLPLHTLSRLRSLYSTRSERAFCQELDYNLLYRWFLDMDLMEPSVNPTVFTKNKRRLLRHKVGRKLFEEVAYEADKRGLMSDEHFSVDGTLIEAAASIKSFRRRDENDERRAMEEARAETFGERSCSTPPT